MPTFLSAPTCNGKTNYGVAVFDRDGNILSRYRLPAQGHGMTSGVASPWLVAVARRPVNFALAIDVKSGKSLLFKSPSHAHFYGHGAFSSPRCNTLLVVDAAKSAVIKQQNINAVCGIASGEEGFLTTRLSGEIGGRKHSLHWDNHSAGIPYYPPSM